MANLHEFLRSEANGYRSRDVLKLAPGVAATLKHSTVMGQITATKLWKAYSPTATDGSEVARAVSLNDPDKWFGAVVGIVRDAEIEASLVTGLDEDAAVSLAETGVISTPH